MKNAFGNNTELSICDRGGVQVEKFAYDIDLGKDSIYTLDGKSRITGFNKTVLHGHRVVTLTLMVDGRKVSLDLSEDTMVLDYHGHALRVGDLQAVESLLSFGKAPHGIARTVAAVVSVVKLHKDNLTMTELVLEDKDCYPIIGPVVLSLSGKDYDLYGDRQKPCDNCDGTGHEYRQAGFFQQKCVCRKCHGSGRVGPESEPPANGSSITVGSDLEEACKRELAKRLLDCNDKNLTVEHYINSVDENSCYFTVIFNFKNEGVWKNYSRTVLCHNEEEVKKTIDDAFESYDKDATGVAFSGFINSSFPFARERDYIEGSFGSMFRRFNSQVLGLSRNTFLKFH